MALLPMWSEEDERGLPREAGWLFLCSDPVRTSCLEDFLVTVLGRGLERDDTLARGLGWSLGGLLRDCEALVALAKCGCCIR